tara:strand:- start:2312 stop:3052 length:741 start_codon:yes stop_codon:yes gene_type:complete
MYKRTIKGQEYVLYDNEEEFKKHRPKTNLHGNWRTAKTNQWIKTDDGKITKVIKRGSISRGKKKDAYIRTVLGMVNCERAPFIGGEPVYDIWRFGKVGWYEKTLNGQLSTKKRIFAKYVASGLKPLDAYMKAFPDCGSVDYANERVRVLLKSEKVKNLIDKEIEVLLSDTGITKTYLLEQTKDIVDKKDTRDSDKLRALETLMKIAGMLSTEKKTESLALIQEFSGFSQEKLNAFKAGVLPPSVQE